MAGETIITVVGNLTDDPELRFTPSGAAVANFTVASTPRTFDKNSNEWVDQEAMFLRCSIWRQAAENVAESLQRGMRVVVQGRLKARTYETREGEKRTVFEVEVDEVGPCLTFATAKVNRSSGSSVRLPTTVMMVSPAMRSPCRPVPVSGHVALIVAGGTDGGKCPSTGPGSDQWWSGRRTLVRRIDSFSVS
jgi:single stranded DNA-binding protein